MGRKIILHCLEENSSFGFWRKNHPLEENYPLVEYSSSRGWIIPTFLTNSRGHIGHKKVTEPLCVMCHESCHHLSSVVHPVSHPGQPPCLQKVKEEVTYSIIIRSSSSCQIISINLVTPDHLFDFVPLRNVHWLTYSEWFLWKYIIVKHQVPSL